MTQEKSRRRARQELPATREIDLPPRDYQPSKAELDQEHTMPGADLKTVRPAFFRPIKVSETEPDAA